MILFSLHESVNLPFSFVMVPAIKEESFADKRDIVTNSMGLYSLSVTSPEIMRFCAWEMTGTMPNINNNHTFMIVLLSLDAKIKKPFCIIVNDGVISR